MGSEWRSSKIVVSTVAAFLLVTGEPAGADMSFFSTFGPGDSYDINVGLPVGGWDGDYAAASRVLLYGPAVLP